jgi:hypothetical protein
VTGSTNLAAGGLTSLPSLGSAVGKIDQSASPLSPLLNVTLGNTQVLGTAGQTAAINAGILTGTQPLSLSLSTPAGVPNPVSALTNPAGPLGALTTPLSSGAATLNGALASSPIGSVANQLTNTLESPTATAPLAGLTTTLSTTLSSLTSTLSSPTAASASPTTALTSPLGKSGLGGTVTGLLSGLTGK